MRKRIIQGAFEETDEKGFKFTMNDLARRLGISKRTIYEEFSSKEELVGAMLDQFLEHIKAKEQKILNNDQFTLAEKIRQLALMLPNDFRIVNKRDFYTVQRYYPEQWHKIQKWQEEWEPARTLIEKGIADGALRKVNIDVLKKIINEARHALRERHFLENNNITFEEAASTVIDIVLFGIVCKGR